MMGFRRGLRHDHEKHLQWVRSLIGRPANMRGRARARIVQEALACLPGARRPGCGRRRFDPAPRVAGALRHRRVEYSTSLQVSQNADDATLSCDPGCELVAVRSPKQH